MPEILDCGCYCKLGRTVKRLVREHGLITIKQVPGDDTIVYVLLPPLAIDPERQWIDVSGLGESSHD